MSLHVYWMQWYDFKVERNKVPLFHLDGRTGAVPQGPGHPPSSGAVETPAWHDSYCSPEGSRKVELALRRGLYAAYFADMERHYFLDGAPYANSYLRFENLQEDYASLCQRLALNNTRLPRAKTELRPDHDDYRRYYTAWSRQQVADNCGRMLDESATASTERDQLGEQRHHPPVGGRLSTYAVVAALGTGFFSSCTTSAIRFP